MFHVVFRMPTLKNAAYINRILHVCFHIVPLDVVMKIDAQALHDYTARSEKELSFKRGDLLQVIEKTADNNWWDGVIQGKRGYIPVAYIEILELNPVSETAVATPSATINVPAPPERRSSMPVSEGTTPTKPVSDSPTEEAILEGTEGHVTSPRTQTHPPSEDTREKEVSTPELRVEHVEEQVAAAYENVSEPQGEVKLLETPEKDEAKPQQDGKTPSGARKPIRSGAVKSLTQQYEPPSPQQRVLVEPHSHRRQQSDSLKRAVDGGDMHPRSASGGSKVGMLSSAFESKAAATPQPPPIKPKPMNIPSSPITEQQQHAAMAFPLISHPGSGYSGVSPLQRAAYMGQSGKPAPPPPAQAQAQHKKPGSKQGSMRGPKRDKSFKSPDKGTGKPSLPAKPPAPAKPSYVPPPGMGGLHSKDLKEEMAARLKKQQN